MDEPCEAVMRVFRPSDLYIASCAYGYEPERSVVE